MRESIYTVTGSVERSIKPNESTVSYPLFSGSRLPVVQTSSLLIKNSVRHVREKQSKLNARFKLGVAYNSEIGQAGTQNAFAPPPTTSYSSLGVNHSYVSQVLSASRHEQQSMNCYANGVEVLESSPVAATGVLYYEKNSRFRTVTYKYKTTAADWPWDSVSGSFISASVYSTSVPRSFPIIVNETGKLQNIRVWVEIVHVSAALMPCLSDLGLAIRAPHIRWGHAHPIRNDKFYKAWGDADPVGNGFYDSTFLLWEGTTLFDPNVFNGSYNTVVRTKYPSWDRDRNMRTIFEDGSPIPNPRHLEGSPTANTNGAPNSAIDATPTAIGNDVPWTSDASVAGHASYDAAGSPPKGWLTGAGGAAASNEWATTGSNYGAATIKPLYPMLDGIRQKKSLVDNNEAPAGTLDYGTAGPGTSLDFFWIDWERWDGFRPGMRGTEISGTWELLVTRGAPNDDAQQSKTALRQWRLELTYEIGVPAFSKTRDASRRGNKTSPQRSTRRQILRISGSDNSRIGAITTPNQDWFANSISVVSEKDNEIGRTFGIVTNTGSLDDGNFSLFYRLSGNLADQIGEAPHWLTNNVFGMPMIPESSSSLVTVTTEVLNVVENNRSIVDVLVPNKQKQTTAAGYARSRVKNKTLQELAIEFAAPDKERHRSASDIDGTYVYVCDGTEGTEFYIFLPYPLSDAKYEVFGSFNGVGGSTLIDFPRLAAGDRTKEKFKVVLGAPAAEGDRIAFTLQTTIKEI